MEILDAICEALGRLAHAGARKIGIARSSVISHSGYSVLGYLILATAISVSFIIWGVINVG